jgi:hypothetical protein
MSISWDEAKRIIEDGSVEQLARLERNADVLTLYRAFRAELVNEWATVTDYLVATVFSEHASVLLQDDGRKKAKLLVVDEQVKVWRPNDFPYDFEAGVKHYCLWCTVPLSRNTIIYEIALKFCPDEYDYLFFINPPSLQSIRNLWHCHVMVRQRLSMH